MLFIKKFPLYLFLITLSIYIKLINCTPINTEETPLKYSLMKNDFWDLLEQCPEIMNSEDRVESKKKDLKKDLNNNSVYSNLQDDVQGYLDSPFPTYIDPNFINNMNNYRGGKSAQPLLDKRNMWSKRSINNKRFLYNLLTRFKFGNSEQQPVKTQIPKTEYQIKKGRETPKSDYGVHRKLKGGKYRQSYGNFKEIIDTQQFDDDFPAKMTSSVKQSLNNYQNEEPNLNNARLTELSPMSFKNMNSRYTYIQPENSEEVATDDKNERAKRMIVPQDQQVNNPDYIKELYYSFPPDKSQLYDGPDFEMPEHARVKRIKNQSNE